MKSNVLGKKSTSFHLLHKIIHVVCVLFLKFTFCFFKHKLCTVTNLSQDYFSFQMAYKSYARYILVTNTLMNANLSLIIIGVVVVVIIWQLDLQLLVQSVPITTKVVSSNTRSLRGVLIMIQHYVIKFVCDLR